ncbi:trehalose-phosphatase [Hydrogenophaga sp. BPS33]|uniref:trehalose-phosphatase n=1 Tax=Hydrogenophaga sp. BPS33 TaxID=2651974 RepID=UPI00131F7E2F|nr:trehalose-phosphatase [Hydrogenophaga sp. BPS33]QHE84236.1 trehalose-phosphatase [Hydrogenophaga sp. BPS33]
MSTFPKLLPDRSALFLDFDGTLADLASRPDAVKVHPDLVALLNSLQQRLDGALALITGRAREDLEPMLASPWPWPAAFEHGAVRLSYQGDTTTSRSHGLDRALAAAEHLVQRHGGLLLERKRTSISLHYRLAPSLGTLCADTLARAIANAPDLQLLHGKSVVEVKSINVSKGTAIEAFMQEAPFAGRMPVFAGDDVTDEAGFTVVQRLGGQGIKVGDGATRARHRCPSPEALRAWLADTLLTTPNTAP